MHTQAMKLQTLAYIGSIITSQSILTAAKSIRGGDPLIESVGDISSAIDANDDARDLEGQRAVQGHEDAIGNYRMFPREEVDFDPEFRHLQDGTNQLKKEARIIGGTESSVGEFDYSVSMQDKKGHFCGGSLITPNMVLTAAHCLGGSYDVVVGRTRDISNGRNGQKIRMKKEIRHPKYNAAKTDSDFALLVLETPVDMTQDNVGLVKLNTNRGLPNVGSSVTVVGWGDTRARGLAPDLMKVDVKVISNDQCDDSSGTIGGYRDNYNGQITDNMLCAHVNGGGRDACQGDSGGPLVMQTNGRHTQVGVVSWGIGCATAAFPGVYSRISEVFDNWIDGEVCKRNEGGIPEEFSCGSGGNDNGPNPSTSRPTNNPTPPPIPSQSPPGTPQPNNGGSNPKWREVFKEDLTKTHANGGMFIDGGSNARTYWKAKGRAGVVRLQKGKTNAEKASVYTDPIKVNSDNKCQAVVDFYLLGMDKAGGSDNEWCIEYSESKEGTDNAFQTARCFSPGGNENYYLKRWWNDETAEFSVKNMEAVIVRLRCKADSKRKDVLIDKVMLQCQ